MCVCVCVSYCLFYSFCHGVYSFWFSCTVEWDYKLITEINSILYPYNALQIVQGCNLQRILYQTYGKCRIYAKFILQ